VTSLYPYQLRLERAAGLFPLPLAVVRSGRDGNHDGNIVPTHRTVLEQLMIRYNTTSRVVQFVRSPI